MAEEKNFEHKVERFLQECGIYPSGFPEDKITTTPVGWYFKVWGGGFQKSGIPDLILNVVGLFIAVELKAEHGKPSELQKLNTNRIRDSGGEACFLYPSGFEDFQHDITDMLEEHDELMEGFTEPSPATLLDKVYRKKG